MKSSINYRECLGPGDVDAEDFLADGLHVRGDDNVVGQQSDPLVVRQCLNDGNMMVQVNLYREKMAG